MTNYKLDWTAPIDPAGSMFGLPLGMTSAETFKVLGCTPQQSGKIVSFSNSPRLAVDVKEYGVVLLRAADVKDAPYEWQNLVGRLIFQHGKLALIVADRAGYADEHSYKGKLFKQIGLGSSVADLAKLVALRHDEDHELFYSNDVPGMEIGGHSSLSNDPNQTIWHIRIYDPGVFNPLTPNSF